jgi:hypothetical protein
LLDPVAKHAIQRNKSIGSLCWKSPMQVWGGFGRLAACFSTHWRPYAKPAMGYGLRHEYGIFKQTKDGWQHGPDNWPVAPILGSGSPTRRLNQPELLV